MNPKTVMTPDDEPVIVIFRTVAAPRQLVFRCYTDPVHLVHFWGPHGSRMPVCELDLRPGGIWRQVLQFAEGAGRKWCWRENAGGTRYGLGTRFFLLCGGGHVLTRILRCLNGAGCILPDPGKNFKRYFARVLNR